MKTTKLPLIVFATAALTLIGTNANAYTAATAPALPDPTEIPIPPIATSMGKLPGVNELPTQWQMPDPLTMNDGTKVTTPAQWAKRREEILKIMEYYAVGLAPPAPGNTKGRELLSILSSDGKARYRLIHLTFGPGEKLSLDVGIITPTSGGPYPVVINLGGEPPGGTANPLRVGNGPNQGRGLDVLIPSAMPGAAPAADANAPAPGAVTLGGPPAPGAVLSLDGGPGPRGGAAPGARGGRGGRGAPGGAGAGGPGAGGFGGAGAGGFGGGAGFGGAAPGLAPADSTALQAALTTAKAEPSIAPLAQQFNNTQAAYNTSLKTVLDKDAAVKTILDANPTLNVATWTPPPAFGGPGGAVAGGPGAAGARGAPGGAGARGGAAGGGFGGGRGGRGNGATPITPDSWAPALTALFANGNPADQYARQYARQLARGYGMVVFSTGDIASDSTLRMPDGSFAFRTSGIMPAYPGYDWAILRAWAWGASRVVDYLVTDPEIDKRVIGVTGVSRTGKAAMFAGAFDERITVNMPDSQGGGGNGAYRFSMWPTISQENLDVDEIKYPNWYSTNLHEFWGHPEKLPFDNHFWYALTAPRLFIAFEGDSDTTSFGPAVKQGWLAGKKVYDFLGVPNRIAVIYGHHPHAAPNPEDWEDAFDFIDHQILGKNSTRNPITQGPGSVIVWNDGTKSSAQFPPITDGPGPEVPVPGPRPPVDATPAPTPAP